MNNNNMNNNYMNANALSAAIDPNTAAVAAEPSVSAAEKKAKARKKNNNAAKKYRLKQKKKKLAAAAVLSAAAAAAAAAADKSNNNINNNYMNINNNNMNNNNMNNNNNNNNMNTNNNNNSLSATTTTNMNIIIEAQLIRENLFQEMSYLPWIYFDQLLTIGLLKKIKKDYCQNNRDKARMKNSINPSKKIILEQQLDLELVNKGKARQTAKVYYAAKHGHVVKAESVVTNLTETTIRADPTKRFIGILPNKCFLYVRYYVLKKYRNPDGYNVVRLNRSEERVGCIIQATFSGINRPYGKTLDHMNGFRHDDRFSNTRWATSKEQRANQHNGTNIRNRVVNPPIPFKTMEEATVDFNKHPELDIFVSDSFPTYFYSNKRNRFLHGYQGAKYRRFSFNGKTYQSGRLGIEAITGTMLQPLECVDHLTGTTTNDSISSLRKTHACGNALNHKHRRAGTIRPNTRVAPRKLTVNGLPMCEVLQSGIYYLRKLNGDPRSRPYHICTQIGPPNKRTKYQAFFDTWEEAKKHYDMVYSENSAPHLP